MGKQAAMRAARKSMMSGVRHHSRTDVREIVDAAMHGRSPDDLMKQLNLDIYADVLAPTRFRGMQNALICLVTVISRTAIDAGVENELAFALSDYYVNEVEMQSTRQQLEALAREIIEHFAELAAVAQQRRYSLAVTKAVRYIDLHLYDECRVETVAAHVGLNAQYFSTLFKKETGYSPSRYITERKLEEAQYLLRQSGMSVTEVSEALGYCSASHFIHICRRYRDVTPKQMTSRPATPYSGDGNDKKPDSV